METKWMALRDETARLAAQIEALAAGFDAVGAGDVLPHARHFCAAVVVMLRAYAASARIIAAGVSWVLELDRASQALVIETGAVNARLDRARGAP